MNAAFPQKAHNTVALGAQWNVMGWEHFAQVTAHLAGDKDAKYTGF